MLDIPGRLLTSQGRFLDIIGMPDIPGIPADTTRDPADVTQIRGHHRNRECHQN